jgi:hypothetical protein
VRNLEKLGEHNDTDPYVFVECVPTIYPVNGSATPVTPGQLIEYEVPDMYGRPWAHNWEKFWEEGMQRPESEGDIFNFE